jgi:hypothetical protein
MADKRGVEKEASVQEKYKTKLMQIGKWTFLSLGSFGVFFSFVAWFLVPGTADVNRLVVASLFASLAINFLLLGGVFFSGSAEDDFHFITSIFRTPPIIFSGLFLLTFVFIAATVPWWGKH